MIVNPVTQGTQGLTWIPIAFEAPATRAPSPGTTYRISVDLDYSYFTIIFRINSFGTFIVYANSDDGLKSISTSGAMLYDSGSTFDDALRAVNISFTVTDFEEMTKLEYAVIYP